MPDALLFGLISSVHVVANRHGSRHYSRLLKRRPCRLQLQFFGFRLLDLCFIRLLSSFEVTREYI